MTGVSRCREAGYEAWSGAGKGPILQNVPSKSFVLTGFRVPVQEQVRKKPKE